MTETEVQEIDNRIDLINREIEILEAKIADKKAERGNIIDMSWDYWTQRQIEGFVSPEELV